MNDNEKAKKNRDLLAILAALCSLNKPSAAMITAYSGVPEWKLRRYLRILSDFGVEYRYSRSSSSPDGGRGFYELTDLGIFDREKLVQFSLREGK